MTTKLNTFSFNEMLHKSKGKATHKGWDATRILFAYLVFNPMGEGTSCDRQKVARDTRPQWKMLLYLLRVEDVT